MAWATPNAHDGRRPGHEQDSTQGRNLKREAEQWATPTAKDDQADSPNAIANGRLKHQAPQWASPKSRDYKGGQGAQERHSPDLDKMAEAFPPSRPVPVSVSDGPQSSPSIPNLRRRLNPRFVTWLMGWPLDWFDVTAFPFSETVSSPHRQPTRGERS